MYTLRQSFIDPNTLDSEITNLGNQQKELQNQLVSLGNIRTSLTYKQQELNRLRNEGNNAYREAQNIGIGKVCSHCGQVIKNNAAIRFLRYTKQ